MGGAMAENPLRKLESYGQSIWLDFIRRRMLESGELLRYIDEDGVSGMTSNPSIFEKAIAGSHDYDASIRELALTGQSAQAIYRTLTIADIQRAADLFHPIYEQRHGDDGYISLEVSPHLAHDADGTINEARSLWQAVDRPNCFIKVPATREGLTAIRQLTSDGINVNVTLLFGIPRYHEVAEAYLSGLEARAAQGQPLDQIRSVASFFLSRIDVLIDPKLEVLMHDPEYAIAETAGRLHGQVAIASAKVAYQDYQTLVASARMQSLITCGARPQRLLWASTSTKNPAYSDTKYVEPLIGPETINTLPLETLDAYRDHGHPTPRLEEDVDTARGLLQRLGDLSINLDAITQQLEDEGVEKFNKPYDQLMASLEQKRAALLATPVDRQAIVLPPGQEEILERLPTMNDEGFSLRLWRKDPTLWTHEPDTQREIKQSLGWLHVAEKMDGNLQALTAFVAQVKADGFQHVVHMGMGGSSLAPLVFQRTFPVGKDGLPLTVLDTTDPVTIQRLTDDLPLAQTLFIVASKSGTTTEPLAFFDYFYAKVQASKGDRAGENFVAITDPGTPLAKLAEERRFRHIFLNFADIGGRYSALSYFGLVPAALLGIDLDELLLRALRMEHACAISVPVPENPGIVLGTVLGECAVRGINKATFLTPPSLAALGLWLEQLLAESTGKAGTGILPVAGEPLGPPSVYGDDRLLCVFYLDNEPDDTFKRGIQHLQNTGHPMVTIILDDRYDLAQEFFRWEMATATAGAILGINAFDQPNVQEGKDNTNRLLEQYTQTGHLPEPQPALVEQPLSLFDGQVTGTLTEIVRQFLAHAPDDGYLAVLAYLPEETATTRTLQALQATLRNDTHLSTTVGYGPRYLHSTGQFHKGGPKTGLFLLLTTTPDANLAIPEKPYTFDVLRQAQALGDFEALCRHEQRAIRIALGHDVSAGLAALQRIIQDITGTGRRDKAA